MNLTSSKTLKLVSAGWNFWLPLGIYFLKVLRKSIIGLTEVETTLWSKLLSRNALKASRKEIARVAWPIMVKKINQLLNWKSRLLPLEKDNQLAFRECALISYFSAGSFCKPNRLSHLSLPIITRSFCARHAGPPFSLMTSKVSKEFGQSLAIGHCAELRVDIDTLVRSYVLARVMRQMRAKLVKFFCWEIFLFLSGFQGLQQFLLDSSMFRTVTSPVNVAP